MTVILFIDDLAAIENCKVQILQLEGSVDLLPFLPHYTHSSVKTFLKWLLSEKKMILDEKMCMLDFVLNLSMSSNYKADLLCLLLKHGAKIQYCTKIDGTPFLGQASILAIEAGNVIKSNEHVR